MGDETINKNENESLLNSMDSGDEKPEQSSAPDAGEQTNASESAVKDPDGEDRIQNSDEENSSDEESKSQSSENSTDAGKSDAIDQNEIDDLFSSMDQDSNIDETTTEKSKTEPEQKNEDESGNILSQGDIDDLINSFGEADAQTGNTAPSVKFENDSASESSAQTSPPLKIPSSQAPNSRRYKLYDFRRPEKLSRDQNRKIKSYFEAMPRHLTNYLAKLLRTRVEVSLIEIDQKNYGDMFKASSTPTIYGIFDMGHSHPSGIIEFSTYIFYSILERMIGGSGRSVTPMRPITEFEKYLLADLLNQILQYYRDIFSKLSPIDPQIELIETDGQLIPKALAEDEVLVRSVYEIRINGLSGYMNISVPYNLIGPFFARFRNGSDGSNAEKSDFSSNVVTKNLGSLKIPMSIEFGKTKIPAIDAATISRGSIITLEHPCDEELRVKVNGKLKFFARPGMRGNKLAIKITSSVEGEG